VTPGLLGSYEQLHGEVLGLVQVEPDDACTGIVELGSEGGDGPAVRCTGPLAALVEGQYVTMVGRWQDRAGRDARFEAVSYERIAPEPPLDPEHRTRWLGPVRWPEEVVSAVEGRFGAQTAKIARSDPYRMLVVDRVRFGHVDDLGRHLGLAPTDPRRVLAAALAAVSAFRRQGHQHLGRGELVAATARLAGVDRLVATEGVAAAIGERRLDREIVGDVEVVATPGALRAERELATDLLRLLRTDRSGLRPRGGDPTPGDPTPGDPTSGELPPALRTVFTCPVSVLIGGRAGIAQAMARITRVAGTTGLRVGEDLVVIDADTCGDTASFGRRVARVREGAHLLVHGDPGLLPPRGAGQVLHDLVGSGLVPVTELSDAAGRIVDLSREVLAGEVGVLRGAAGDVFMAEEPTHGDLVARVVRAVTRRIPQHLGVHLDGIQVLTPRREGPVGVRAVEAGLTETLGRPLRSPSVRTIHASVGRSWPVVVLVADVSDRGVLDRRMLYTAMTRAEQALIVVGQAETVRTAARWEHPVTRRTGLQARLRT
jgi:hypothetical protein